jgi:hypothetical protein
MKRFFLANLFTICILFQLTADNTVAFSEYKKAVTISIGTDLSIVTLQVNYTQSFTVNNWNRNLVLDTGFSIPIFNPDLKDFRLSAGVKIDTVKAEYFLIPVSLKLIFRGHSNEAHSSKGLGMELAAFPGFYNNKFTAAAELVWDSELCTYIKYSDYYRYIIYDKAAPGWYGFTSNMFRIGARTGVLFRDRDELSLRGGYEYHGRYNLKIPPVYAVLGNSIRF